MCDTNLRDISDINKKTECVHSVFVRIIFFPFSGSPFLRCTRLFFGQMSGASVSSRCGADGITRFRYVNNNSRASNATAHYCA